MFLGSLHQIWPKLSLTRSIDGQFYQAMQPEHTTKQFQLHWNTTIQLCLSSGTCHVILTSNVSLNSCWYSASWSLTNQVSNSFLWQKKKHFLLVKFQFTVLGCHAVATKQSFLLLFDNFLTTFWWLPLHMANRNARTVSGKVVIKVGKPPWSLTTLPPPPPTVLAVWLVSWRGSNQKVVKKMLQSSHKQIKNFVHVTVVQHTPSYKKVVGFEQLQKHCIKSNNIFEKKLDYHSFRSVWTCTFHSPYENGAKRGSGTPFYYQTLKS